MPNRRRTPINEVLARNIAGAMKRRNIATQKDLAKLCGLSQRSISNYLHPENHSRGASGKAPSAKLSEVEKIAHALDVDPCDLLRDMTPSERETYQRIEAAFRALRGTDGDPPSSH